MADISFVQPLTSFDVHPPTSSRPPSDVQPSTGPTSPSTLRRPASDVHLHGGGVLVNTTTFVNNIGVPLVKDLDKEQKRELNLKLGIYAQAFSVGLGNNLLTFGILLRWPQFFWVWHLVLGFIYLPWRFKRFSAKNKEWYMMDFCYFVQYAALIVCILAALRTQIGYESPLSDYNYGFMRAFFAFANGALVLSVPLFGNKVVLHDIDNTTGIYIHFSPAILMYALRWGVGFGTSKIEEAWPMMFQICKDMVEADISTQSFSHALWYDGPCRGTAYEFALYPGLVWLIMWGIPYYIIMFCVLKGYFEERPEKEFLYRDALKPGRIEGVVFKKLPEPLWQLGFMLCHGAYIMVAGFISIAFWNSFVLHTVFLVSIYSYAVNNGSKFLFEEVAAKRIQKSIHKAGLSQIISEPKVGTLVTEASQSTPPKPTLTDHTEMI